MILFVALIAHVGLFTLTTTASWGFSHVTDVPVLGWWEVAKVAGPTYLIMTVLLTLDSWRSDKARR